MGVSALIRTMESKLFLNESINESIILKCIAILIAEPVSL